MSSPRKGTFSHVEHARQALVNSEEAYLVAQGWRRVQVASEWLWQKKLPAGIAHEGEHHVTMTRTEAAWLQFIRLGDGK